ncbi:hypothetical protein EDB83DRAFT_2475149 [Lactarius deliciosus]|nr:hypothetical protein EDB83DRAFT_2475149 [Lactarius deliciosus]
MTTAPEPTLSLLAWLVTFAMIHGFSPAVPEMPSVGSGKTKAHEEVLERLKAGGKRFCSWLNKIGMCRPAVSMPLPFLLRHLPCEIRLIIQVSATGVSDKPIGLLTHLYSTAPSSTEIVMGMVQH